MNEKQTSIFQHMFSGSATWPCGDGIGKVIDCHSSSYDCLFHFMYFVIQ